MQESGQIRIGQEPAWRAQCAVQPQAAGEAEAGLLNPNPRIQRQWVDLLLRLHSQCIGRRTLPRHLHLTHQETLWPERFGPVLAPPSPPWHAPAMVAFPS